MELWIRSQDKEVLLNIKGIQYQNYKLVENETVEANILIGLYNYYDNEIKRLITDLQCLNYGIKNDEFCSYRPNVYEMPEK